MSSWSLALDAPWFLALLGLLPLLWWYGLRHLGALGPVRRWLALLLRSGVFALLVLALCEPQLVRYSDQMTVIYLLDQSLSIPQQQRRGMIRAVNRAIQKHRQGSDRVGVIVFGRDAAMELPPLDESLQLPERIESFINPESTNLESAMKLAAASFPEGTMRRVVVISDGSQNLGNAVGQARQLARQGVAIDTVAVRYPATGEVLVERVVIPGHVARDQPFELRAVLTNTGDSPVPGRLEFFQRVQGRLQSLDDGGRKVVLAPGKNVFVLRHRIKTPGFFEFVARFVPDDPMQDGLVQNNQAGTFTFVRGRGQVLLVENYEEPESHSLLAKALQEQGFALTLRSSDRAFANLADLQQFDVVILGNVPRGGDAQRGHLTDEQVRMLVSSVRHLGTGLVILGGPSSFGAGGWADTPLEEASPLWFRIRNVRVVPKGALAIILHACETPQGNFWEKKVAEAAIRALGYNDYCGVLEWNGKERWLWPGGLVPVGPNRNMMLAKLDRMQPGDMPDFDTTLKLALMGFNRLRDAAIKHTIIISDGDPTPASNGVLRAFRTAGITISTVAVAAHGPAGHRELRRIARFTGGKYYQVRNNRALPRIFQKEARQLSRPLVYDQPPPMLPRITYPHEMLRGITGVPPVEGYVLTRVKDNPLVEVSLMLPRPPDRDNALLASWTYGLGRVVCFTSDAGRRWTTRWTGWEGYKKFFGQMVRWAMRPGKTSAHFTTTARYDQGQIEVVVTALDTDDEFINQLNIVGKLVAPDGKSRDFQLRQVAPGRYVGRIPAQDQGSYFLVMSPGEGHQVLRAGVNIPYSAEFRRRETDEALLRQLASIAPEGVPPGRFAYLPENEQEMERFLQINPFRRDLPRAQRRQGRWYWFALAGLCLFFADVLIRRVHIDLVALVRLAAGWWRRWRHGEEAPQERTLERLQRRKAQVSRQLRPQAAVRYQVQDLPPEEAQPVEESPPTEATPAEEKSAAEPDQASEEHTRRLLEAKKKLWKRRGGPEN